MDLLIRAQEIWKIQRDAINQLAITPHFASAIELIINTFKISKQVITLGMGKAGIIAQKMSATLTSIGIPSVFLHPAEAVHGDIGRVRSGDLVIIFSHSGRTEEIQACIKAIDLLNRNNNKKILISSTGEPSFSVDILLNYGAISESCVVSKVPSTSTTIMLLIADILAITAAEALGLNDDVFQSRHPGGSIGKTYRTYK